MQIKEKKPDKPSNIEEYRIWLLEQHSIEINGATQNHYESVVNKIKRDFEDSDIWQTFISNFKKYNQTYFIDTAYSLTIREDIPQFQVKSFDSFLLKTFRKNVLNNVLWPSAPSDGWVLPQNWYFRINDTVRTCFVTKYLDGVEFLAESLNVLAREKGVASRVDYEAKEEGYYAAHLYLEFEAEVPKINWNTETICASIEIQITTQLQEVIKNLLHIYYEDRRKGSAGYNRKWQWDYKSDEFSTNYLGHILHYIEGMIMDIREKQNSKKGDSDEKI